MENIKLTFHQKTGSHALILDSKYDEKTMAYTYPNNSKAQLDYLFINKK